MYGSLWLMLFLRYDRVEEALFSKHLPVFSVIFFIWLIVFYISGFYDYIYCRIRLSYLLNFVKVLLVNFFICVSFFYITPYLINRDIITPKRNIILYFLVFFFAHLVWRQLYYTFMKSRAMVNNIAIIGATDKIGEIINRLTTASTLGYRLKLIMGATEIDPALFGVETLQLVPEIDELTALFIARDIKTIVIDDHTRMDHALVQKLYQCLPLKIDFIKFSQFYENITGKVPAYLIKKVWFLGNLKEAQKRNYERGRRLADYILVVVLFFFFLIVLPFVALATKVNSPGPIFYRQRRVGRHGKIFELIKFRSMIVDAEKDGAQWSGVNDRRITKLGKFLRCTHVDELPQIINILKGDMSVVGPRPERPEFVEQLVKEIPYYQIRHLIRPGITGWAQLNFRYGASIADAMEKLQYDLFYIKNRSLILDFSIFLKTVNRILKRN